MKTMIAMFFVLAITLVVIPLIAEAQEEADAKKIPEEGVCTTVCADKKEPTINNNCKESCTLSQRANLVFLESVTCLGKCTQYDNVPAMKSCEEGCKKDYKAKAEEVTASCNAVCSKVEKDSLSIEKCKDACTPPPT